MFATRAVAQLRSPANDASPPSWFGSAASAALIAGSMVSSLARMVGAPMMGGLARKLFDAFGDDPERRLLLDCLLQLSPGYIQVMAALMERWFDAGSGSIARGGDDGEPSIASVGGTPDSCYIWRVGGPMGEMRISGFEGPRPARETDE